MLRDAGWSPARTQGSHTLWRSGDGTRSVAVPDGHRTISPGVARRIFDALKEEK
jgi:predicted RNA binding protein YcfA (HicA-like mRNA interferase family)